MNSFSKLLVFIAACATLVFINKNGYTEQWWPTPAIFSAILGTYHANKSHLRETVGPLRDATGSLASDQFWMVSWTLLFFATLLSGPLAKYVQ